MGEIVLARFALLSVVIPLGILISLLVPSPGMALRLNARQAGAYEQARAFVTEAEPLHRDNRRIARQCYLRFALVYSGSTEKRSTSSFHEHASLARHDPRALINNVPTGHESERQAFAKR